MNHRSTPEWDQFEVVAEGLGRYTIDVSLPANAPPDARLPIILVVDGKYHFDLVRTLVHGRYAGLGSLLPPSIVVGVGYPADEGLASNIARRSYDFHDPWDMTDALGAGQKVALERLKLVEGRPSVELRAGGYGRFMAFLRDELLPRLAEGYPVDRTVRHTLVGHSSGGHFAVRAVFDPESPFSRYVAISPGGGAEGAIQRAITEYAATHQDLTADVFMCAGSAEIGGTYGAMTRFASDMARTAELCALKQWPSLRLSWEIMDKEDHGSIVARGFAAGLRFVHRVRPGVHDEEIGKAQAAMVEAMFKPRQAADG